MKSIILSIITFMIISTAAYAANFEPALEEEKMVNDIPFNTGWIAMTSGVVPGLEMEEEEYVDDIPFDTEKIMQEALFSSVEKEYSEESNVCDMPFDTRKVVNDYRLEELYAEYQEENQAEDIPFSREYIAYNSLLEDQIMPSYNNEQQVKDIPFYTNSVATEYLLRQEEIIFRDEERISDYPFKTKDIYCQRYECPADARKFLQENISDLEPMNYIHLEAEGFDITRYLDEMMESIEKMHIHSQRDLEKKIFYINHSFDAL